jgi:hypothetical protein
MQDRNYLITLRERREQTIKTIGFFARGRNNAILLLIVGIVVLYEGIKFMSDNDDTYSKFNTVGIGIWVASGILMILTHY